MQRSFTRCLILGASVTLASSASHGQQPLWVRQAGTTGYEVFTGAGVDSAGHAYVGGSSSGSLGGPNLGNDDAVLAKYDVSGVQLWIRQFGTSSLDYIWPVAVNGAGDVWAGGTTRGHLGGVNAGGGDVFLVRFNSMGTQVWARQLGTAGDDECWGVAVDASGNAFVSGVITGSLGGPLGQLPDAFLAKYDAAGTQQWVRQINPPGTPYLDYEQGGMVAVDLEGNAFLCCTTGPILVGYFNDDVLLIKFDPSGTELWSRQLGTPGTHDEDSGWDVATDSVGAAYVTGHTRGSLGGPNAGGRDAFLAKYDASGTLLWIRQFGTSLADTGNAVATDSAGGVYVSGFISWDFTSGSNDGDAFVAKFDASGTPLWTHILGSPQQDDCLAVTVDGVGGVYIAGATWGSLGGPIAGSYDAWLARYAGPCYPNCDASTGTPPLTANDFICFITKFAAGDTYANCDGSTSLPALTANDFTCFLNAFVMGCS